MAESGFILKIENPYPVPHEDVVELLPGRVVRVGRGEGNEVVILNQYISRHHFTLAWNDNKLVLQDQKSLNGTKVNGRKVKEQQELHTGDRIEISNVKITVVSTGEVPSTTQPPAPGGIRPSATLPFDQTIASSVTLVNEAPPRPAHFVTEGGPSQERRRRPTIWEGSGQQSELLQAARSRKRLPLIFPLALGLLMSVIIFLFF